MKLTKAAAAAVVLAVSLPVLAACGSSGPAPVASHSESPGSSAASSPAAPPAAAAPQVTDPNGQTCDSFDSTGYCSGDDPLTCDTVVDPTGWSNGPLTEVRAIAIATAVSDTDFTGIIEGTLTDTEMHLLNVAATELNQGSDNNDQPGRLRLIPPRFS